MSINYFPFLDDGKLLALARDRMMLSREQMAGKLSLDPAYLAQLENGARKVGGWYLHRAAELICEFERVNH